MSVSRRKFLLTTTGGMILAAAGSAAVFVSTRTPHRALEPWQLAGSAYSEPRQRALSYALLAPNPHNRQPWIADLSVEDTVTLRVDTDRLLKETDPYDRQIVIGFGCFLELLVQAAAADGYRIVLNLFPEGADELSLDKRPIATARFVKDDAVQADPLFQWALKRRTNKEPFDTGRPVADSTLAALSQATGAIHSVQMVTSNDQSMVASFRDVTWRAFQIEYLTPAKLQESIDVMRMGKVEIEANPDGIDVGGGFLESLMLAGVLSRESLADPSSTGFKQGLEMYKPICDTAMAYVWLKTEGNNRLQQIAAGRAWVRMNLAATGLGIGVQPLSQALQEYVEMKELYEKLHQTLAEDGGTIQMLGRLGYGGEITPSPRWSLQHKMVNT